MGVLGGGEAVGGMRWMEGGYGGRGVREGNEPGACTLEMIHAYSRIHDDLPALDNDDLRRGRPTCHKMFGDAMAILAGDALSNLAFHVIAQLPVDADRRIRLIQELSTAAGTVGGMIGGRGKESPAQEQA